MKKGFQQLLLVTSKLILMGDECSWTLSHTWRRRGQVRRSGPEAPTCSRHAAATHVIGADQRADRLQGAEGVVLAVALAAAGVPDQVAALLVGQHVGRRPLEDRVQTSEVVVERAKIHNTQLGRFQPPPVWPCRL